VVPVGRCGSRSLATHVRGLRDQTQPTASLLCSLLGSGSFGGDSQQAVKHKCKHPWRSSKIKANQVIADAQQILDLDLTTASVKDLQVR